MPQLIARIREHLKKHPEVANNPRFSALLIEGGTWRRHGATSITTPGSTSTTQPQPSPQRTQEPILMYPHMPFSQHTSFSHPTGMFAELPLAWNAYHAPSLFASSSHVTQSTPGFNMLNTMIPQNPHPS